MSVLLLIILQILYAFILISVAAHIIIHINSPAKASAYLLLILLVPMLGVIIYLSVGMDFQKKSLYNKKLLLDKQTAHAIESFVKIHSEKLNSEFKATYPDYFGLSQMLFQDDLNMPTVNNSVKLLNNGEEKFPEVIQALKNAKNHIHIEYYIYDNDEIGNEIASILIEKAKQGVTVRFIYDDFGSKSIRKNIVPELIKNGVQVSAFYKITLIYLANRLNYRNHRKIIIVDGNVGFVGGVNVSDKYINSEKSTLFWRDSHLKIEGEAVWSLQKVFLADWNFCSGKAVKPNRQFFQRHNIESSGHWTQVVSSGPDSAYPGILYSYLQIISLAKNELLITTPYFIPGQEFLNALEMAVLRGVKVKLLAPSRSDSWLVNAVSKSHYLSLLKIGVEIYLYQKGFVHAKTMVCDEMLTMVGTANLDARSFDLNFEVNALVYDAQIAKEQKSVFEQDLLETTQLNLEEWSKRNKVLQFIEKLLRLGAPLM